MIHQITSRRYSILERVINFLAKYLLDIQTNHKTVEIFYNDTTKYNQLIRKLYRSVRSKPIIIHYPSFRAVGRGTLQQLIYANVKEICK